MNRQAIEDEIAKLEAHARAQRIELQPPDDDDGTWEPSEDAMAISSAIAERRARLKYLQGQAIRERQLAIEHAAGLHPAPDWNAETNYTPGRVVTHNGRRWIALNDVEMGSAPDDVYDAAAGTGGWKPLS